MGANNISEVDPMTKQELSEKWNNMLDLLYAGMERIKVENFFRPLTPVKLSEKKETIYFKTPGSNPSVYQTIINNNKAPLSDACVKVFGKPYKFEVVEIEPPEEEDEKDKNPIPEDFYYGFNPSYTFENFVQGPNNQLASAACLAIADKGYVKEYNPLFLYSGPGLGKTHLMHAVGQYILRKNPKKRVMYVSSEAFTNELVSAIQEKSTDKFRNKYRKVDVLLFDDVQFISGKTATQEELFNTFNDLYNARKQIIFTSDKPPQELDGIPERLTSRFGQGLPVDIQTPEYETRVAILKNLALLNDIKLTPEVNDLLDLIAQNVTSNIRDLEGAFTRIYATSKLLDKPLNKDLAKMVLTDIFNTKTKEITPDTIKKEVAKFFGVKVSDMESEKRAKNIAFPRQIAIYLIREHTNYSLPQMGRLFGGRDHTTIRHSYEKIAEQIKTDRELQDTVEMIFSQIE